MKYSLISSSLLACSTAALHLPLTRRAPIRGIGAISKPNANVHALAQTGSLNVNNSQNKLYSSTITVNGKDVPVQVDTGSTDFWLYQYADNLLDNAQVYQPLNLSLKYGRGSASGHIAQIDVAFAGFNIANQSFLYVQENNQTGIVEAGFAGLLGLGFDTLSNINRLVEQNFPGATWGRSLLSNIFLSDLSTPNHIAFHLDRLYDNNDTDTGSLDIGTFAPGFEAVNNTAEIPIFSPFQEENRYWSVLLDGVSVNGKNQTLQTTITNGTVPPNGKLAAVLDTGYSLPQVTSEIAAAIYEPLGGVFSKEAGYYIVPCDAQTNVTFYIGGHTIPIHPLDLTLPQVVPLGANGENMTVCFGGFQPFSSEVGSGIIDVILGDAFLRNTYTVYGFGDFANGTSGLPRQDPYIKLLPLTDSAVASAEFPSARKAYLNTLPPQVNISTLDSDNPQPISGSSPSGKLNNGTRFGIGISVASLLTTVMSVLAML